MPREAVSHTTSCGYQHPPRINMHKERAADKLDVMAYTYSELQKVLYTGSYNNCTFIDWLEFQVSSLFNCTTRAKQSLQNVNTH